MIKPGTNLIIKSDGNSALIISTKISPVVISKADGETGRSYLSSTLN